MEQLNVTYMMYTVEDMIKNYDAIKSLQTTSYLIEGRYLAISWMKSCLKLVPHTYEELQTSIQILDKFLHVLPNEEHPDLNLKFFKLVGSVCLTISTKFLSTKTFVALDQFKMFELSELIQYENLILGVIGYEIHSSSIPSNFIRSILTTMEDVKLRALLMTLSDDLISEFITVMSSTLFAPSTIAIAAVSVSFAIVGIDCGSWMKSVPEHYLSHPLDKNGTSLFDVLGCYEILSNMPLARRQLSPYPSRISPTSVTSTVLRSLPMTNDMAMNTGLDLEAIENDSATTTRLRKRRLDDSFLLKPILSSPSSR